VVNLVFGLLLAWVLVRYKFPGKKIVDALVDLPFALPTAVAGISLTALLAGNGWIGQYLEPMGIKLAFTPAGVVIALIFIGLPFVVRTVQPVLEDAEKELEEAATSLGATRLQIFTKVILPHITPALLTGFAMAFARAIGEYGSVIFIAGNMPMISEITPLIIIGKLEQYDYAGATAVAVVMLLVSFVLLLVINGLQAWQRRNAGAPHEYRCISPINRRVRAGTTEAPWVRYTLITVALLFVVLFLVLPLAAVFTEALRKGFGAYLAALREPDAWSAIKLT
jgi:sulfate transport system permease protein